ncbi:ECF transporter S component [Vagococcus xieshaowenii]|uniref:ECF transporter S component n=1 Tax=Vagococcus xieshaowenii TaxID=2562451 RepID=A0A4Z0D713_9ENTE|nr:ECF transporter S component [Vagococcus xieshaowenii]QCA28544.1 ECF transporter S component [Vagococcus xieshaowenii]TFZ40648.1 ECF transporter S component [Vagococcus xieshaowenii]
MKHSKTKDLVLLSIFTAIIFVLSFTPIGYIQLGLIKATIIHVPVIIASILLGPKKGAILGAVFGLTSFISNTTAPVVSSFVFTPFANLPGETHGSVLSLITCFLPRILVGVIPYYIYQFSSRFVKEQKMVNYAISGIAGSLTNTLLVLGSILLLFKDAYAKINEVNTTDLYKIIGGIIFTNGILEAVVAGIIVSLVCRSLMSNKKIEKMIKDLN